MWPNGSSMNNGTQPVEGSWEDMLDSGQLDHQLSKINIAVPPPDFSQPPPPIRYQQQPHSQSNNNVTMLPPRHSHPMSRQMYPGSFPMPTKPTPIQPQPGFHSRPPLLLRRPPSTPNTAQPPPLAPTSNVCNHNPRTSNSFQSTPPQVKIIDDSEHGCHTQYQAPEPVMKILRRPQSSPSNLSGQETMADNGASSKSKKTLKQREEEYAQARLRILGSAENPEDLL